MEKFSVERVTPWQLRVLEPEFFTSVFLNIG